MLSYLSLTPTAALRYPAAMIERPMPLWPTVCSFSRGRPLAAIALGLLVYGIASARAGNYSTYIIGAKSAGMAGAYTALADDPSAAWYNPAGLAARDRHSIDLSVTAYGLQILSADDLIRTHLPEGRFGSDFSTIGLQIAPNVSLNSVWRLSKIGAPVRHALSLAIYVPESSTLRQTFELHRGTDSHQTAALYNGLYEYNQRFTIEDKQVLYAILLSYGVWINEYVSFGVALGVFYADTTAARTLYLNLEPQESPDPDERNEVFSQLDFRYSAMRIGIGGHSGVQLRFGGLRLGLNVRLPVYQFYESEDAAGVTASGRPERFGVNQFADVPRQQAVTGFNQVKPWTFALGIGYAVPGKWRAAAEVDYRVAFRNEAMGINHRHLVNARAGAEIFFNELDSIAFGLFTDFHPSEDLDDFGQKRMDFYGLAVAYTMGKRFLVTENKDTSGITFVTTIGLHYAFGIGKMAGLYLDPFNIDDRPGATLDVPSRRITGHDIFLFVGSGVIL